MKHAPPGLPASSLAPTVVGQAALFVISRRLDDTFLGLLLEHPVRGRPAQLAGFRQLTVEGEGWPLLVPAPGQEVGGCLYQDLDAADFVRLDAYHGVGEGLHRRAELTVRAERARLQAFAYLPTEKILSRLQRRA